jgi:hypothetical protein
VRLFFALERPIAAGEMHWSAGSAGLPVLRLFQSAADFGPGPYAYDGGPYYSTTAIGAIAGETKKPGKTSGLSRFGGGPLAETLKAKTPPGVS